MSGRPAALTSGAMAGSDLHSEDATRAAVGRPAGRTVQTAARSGAVVDGIGAATASSGNEVRSGHRWEVRSALK